MSNPKRLLLASVSSVALALSAPTLMAADLPAKAPVYKSAAVPAPSPWTVWIEGGGQALVGDPFVAGFGGAGFDAPAKRWGWSGAASIDYRFGGVWHVSSYFRYGTNRKRTSASNPAAIFGVPTVTTSPVTVARAIAGNNSATRKEHNWEADFMVGRDLGLGNSQIKAGVRVAEIRGRTEGSASWVVPTSTASTPAFVTHTRSYVQTNKFLGVGPRVALEGNVPLSGPWSIDYMAGVAVLFGSRQFDQTVTSTGAATCLAGCPVNLNSSSSGGVVNPDGMIGLSYAIAPNAKLSANYRVDAYFSSMRALDANGNLKNIDRIYHGPNLRLTFGF